jgi:hypothetical protein
MDNPNGDASPKSNLQKIQAETAILIRLQELRLQAIAIIHRIAEIDDQITHLAYDYTIRHVQLAIEEIEARRVLRGRFQNTETPK